MDILNRNIATVWLAVMAALATPVYAQISPGELSQPHAFLEGMRQCLKCHDLGKGPSDQKCLECHKEIATGIDSRQGYHYRITSAGKRECYDCHSEHAGRGFQLIHWPNGINSFDHEQTGYELAGKHGSLKCRDCHRSDLIREDLSAYGDHVNANRTFLGLHTACLDCHSNEHRGQLSTECTVCHSNDSWKPSLGFDHAKTVYPLTGRHVGLACTGCHPTVTREDPASPGSESFVQFTGLAYGNCTPCHNDIHNGNYGTQCATCHNTSGWGDIPTALFDHAKTRFPLLGLHAGLACDKCHAPGTKKAPVTHEACTDCHTDIHRAQFATRSDGGACKTCHTVDGFYPSLFTVVAHADTRFALTGAHLAQPCFACHPTATAEDGLEYRVFRIDDRSCNACHSDVHFGQFSSARPSKDCTVCHTIDAWTPVLFDHDRDSQYKLEGEHRRVRCEGCHGPVVVGGNGFVRYKPIDPSCKTCHSADEMQSIRDRDKG